MRLGSSGGPISSDPRSLYGNTSSVRPLSAVLGLTFLAVLAAGASLALLAAGAWLIASSGPSWAASTLVATDGCPPAGDTRCSTAYNLCWSTSSFIIACLMRSRHPSLCGFASQRLPAPGDEDAAFRSQQQPAQTMSSNTSQSQERAQAEIGRS